MEVNKEVQDFFANIRVELVGKKLACNNTLALSLKYSQFVSQIFISDYIGIGF